MLTSGIGNFPYGRLPIRRWWRGREESKTKTHHSSDLHMRFVLLFFSFSIWASSGKKPSPPISTNECRIIRVSVYLPPQAHHLKSIVLSFHKTCTPSRSAATTTRLRHGTVSLYAACLHRCVRTMPEPKSFKPLLFSSGN